MAKKKHKCPDCGTELREVKKIIINDSIALKCEKCDKMFYYFTRTKELK